MIVVDSNVIAYCWIHGALTDLAQAVRLRDPQWHAPVLWRSEMRSILTGYLRAGNLDRAQVARIMGAAQAALEGGEHLVPDEAVFELAGESPLSAYDCEFVALATVLSVPLVTADRDVLRAFPDRAMTMKAFLA